MQNFLNGIRSNIAQFNTKQKLCFYLKSRAPCIVQEMHIIFQGSSPCSFSNIRSDRNNRSPKL